MSSSHTLRTRRPAVRALRMLAAVISVGAVTALSACAPPGLDESGGTQERVTVSLAQEPRSMGSWAAVSDEGSPWIYNIEEPLVMRDAETGEALPGLAVSWEQTDPTAWTFQLRENVTFHDGTPFDAEVAAAALNWTWKPENNYPLLQFMGPQITAEASGEHELVITTPEEDPILPSRLFFSPIFSPKTLEDGTYETTPVGTGPYSFVSWERGQYLDVEANPDWWGLEADSDQTALTVQSARFAFNADPAVRASAVQAANADIGVQLQPAQCLPACAKTGSVETILLRLDAETNPMLKDVRVRQAIAEGLDLSGLVEQYVPEGARASQLIREGVTGYNPDLEPYPHDVEHAKELLDEARADGVDLSLPLRVVARTGFVDQGGEIIQVLQAQLAELGFDATSALTENSQLQAGLREKPASPDRGWVLLYSHSNQLGDMSATTGWFTCDGSVSTMCDPELDALTEQAMATSGDERQELFAAAAERLWGDYSVIPVAQPARFNAISESIDWEARNDGLVLLTEITRGA
ncbi:ABC transporter substrate-binding protein [Herbiconiux sp.]|uniref:ABC transporter substrate-binding protein n=1 Tax=Herbiconiux sp. TaxID=1871186 RepID=UPI0025C5C342|nr:ABC transporter substrate-binding protein [Herbiconiux sp.]